MAASIQVLQNLRDIHNNENMTEPIDKEFRSRNIVVFSFSPKEHIPFYYNNPLIMWFWRIKVIKSRVVAILLIAILVYTAYYYANREPQIDLKMKPAVWSHRIWTSACVIPEFQAFDSSIFALYKYVSPFKCPGLPSFIQILPGGVPFIDAETLRIYYGNARPKDISCIYRAIRLDVESEKPDEKFVMEEAKDLIFGERLDAEFSLVKCKQGFWPIHERFLLIPQLKENVEKRSVTIEAKREHLQAETPRLSVYVLGIDSISYLNFQRHMRLTGSYLKENFDLIELRGLNKLGDNSFPNQSPLISGMSYKEAFNKSPDKFFDNYDTIWRRYEEHGYRSAFIEESPKFGLFNYLLNGFRHPPADYYLRPAIMAMDASPLKKNAQGSVNCLGDKMPFELLLEYNEGLFREMGPERPTFVYSWISEIPHDSMNSAGFMDVPVERHLKQLEQQGTLNHTVLIFLSDHGMRYGTIRATLLGKYEDRMPFAFMLFPQSFRGEYPHLYRTLQKNQHRLTTNYDIHATLLHLLHLGEKGVGRRYERTARGISLFTEVPESRTCTDASISAQWCCCRPDRPLEIPWNDPRAQRLATFMVDTIQSFLDAKPGLCRQISLADVLDVRLVRGESNSTAQNFWVTVVTSPGDAIFEGTVRVHANHSLEVIDSISRCNWYSAHTWCVKDHWLEKYCYCKSIIPFV